MTAAPNGQAKAAEENADAKANAVAKPRAKRAATTTANPESVSKPGDKQTADTGLTPDAVQTGPTPVVPGPLDPIPEGTVQVTRKAHDDEPADPAGNITVTEDFKAPKADKFAEIDGTKLPVSVTVGQVVVTIEEYAGRAVASFSLVGWVGDAPFKILAKDIETELEGALKALRTALA
jgi:hypothetical protein